MLDRLAIFKDYILSVPVCGFIYFEVMLVSKTVNVLALYGYSVNTLYHRCASISTLGILDPYSLLCPCNLNSVISVIYLFNLLIFKNIGLVKNSLKNLKVHPQVLISDFYKGKKTVLILPSPFGNNQPDLTSCDCTHSVVPTTLPWCLTSLGICIFNPYLLPSFFRKLSMTGVTENHTALCSEKGTDFI